MLTLKEIRKSYVTGDTTVEALKGVSLSFRDSEFVSVLGPSGCGKTTLLNIIGGLDRYTSGQLEINGKPTDSFSDREWDAYRNHSVGFVFQSYNLIPHQSVLSNVELALTISGVDRAERRRRAKAVLERVGLGDQLEKKPNQMSGGQMQRVAIARALVNDPDILLADEPTGALDSETSVQVMELLKEVARDRLVIMVTHNPELAERYSTRLVRLLDGRIIDDSDPYEPSADEKRRSDEKRAGSDAKKSARQSGKTSMSFLTALSLSLNNLMTKKARTLLTSFAGSIGIIGIALILSLQTGIQAYISRMQEDTLSSYPITIEAESVDMTSLIASIRGSRPDGDDIEHEDGKIYANNIYTELVNTMLSEIRSNDLVAFKKILDDPGNEFAQYVSSVKYTYDIDLNVYRTDTAEGLIKVNPSPLLAEMMSSAGASLTQEMSGMASTMYRMNVWEEMIDDEELMHAQYDCIAGRWPEKYNEVMIVVDKNNSVSDLVLYTLGIKDQAEAVKMFEQMMHGEKIETSDSVYSYEDFLGLKFTMLTTPDGYAYNEKSGIWEDISGEGDKNGEKNTERLEAALAERGVELNVVGIIRPSAEAVASSIGGSVVYTSALTREYIKLTEDSAVIKAQIADPDTDILTGIPFSRSEGSEVTIEDVKAYIATLPEEQRAQLEGYIATMTDEQVVAMFKQYIPTTDATYEGNLKKLGRAALDSPKTISIYAKTFSDKDKISELIEAYNKKVEDEGHDELTIKYTDYVKLLMSSITTVIDVISGILIAFVAISLVVSSIMIGIITYISVLERTKEIGILRAMGASKQDVSRVFNAETFIVGSVSGVIGIGITLILLIPTNIAIHHFSGMENIGAVLPLLGSLGLIAISILMTLIAGLLPSRLAAKKDPVIALRSE